MSNNAPILAKQGYLRINWNNVFVFQVDVNFFKKSKGWEVKSDILKIKVDIQANGFEQAKYEFTTEVFNNLNNFLNNAMLFSKLTSSGFTLAMSDQIEKLFEAATLNVDVLYLNLDRIVRLNNKMSFSDFEFKWMNK